MNCDYIVLVEFVEIFYGLLFFITRERGIL
jgi:hypothetical protein